MTKNIKVEQRLVNLIEALQFEVSARKDIICFMISNAMDTKSEAFFGYHKEYLEYIVQYEASKKELAEIYITDEVKAEFGGKVDWHLDFDTGFLALEVKQ